MEQTDCGSQADDRNSEGETEKAMADPNIKKRNKKRKRKGKGPAAEQSGAALPTEGLAADQENMPKVSSETMSILDKLIYYNTLRSPL